MAKIVFYPKGKKASIKVPFYRKIHWKNVIIYVNLLITIGLLIKEVL